MHLDNFLFCALALLAGHLTLATTPLAKQHIERREDHPFISHRVEHVYNTLGQCSLRYDKIAAGFFGRCKPMAEHVTNPGRGIPHGSVDKWDVAVKCS